VSLILEALRKLERDKDAPARGFVVMTHVPWAQGGKRSRLVGLSALALAVAMGALAIALWWGRGVKPVVPEPRPAAAVTPAPTEAAPLESPSKAPTPQPFDARALALESRRMVTPPLPSAPAASSTATTPLAPIAPASSLPAKAELRLNAISQQDGKPVAILNDRLVHEGDVFGGIRVIRIGETEVEVEVGGARRTLRF